MRKLQFDSECSVFIADDDEDDVFFIMKAFRQELPRIKLKHFVNGRELLHELQSRNKLPQMVLLDINMPVLDGVDTLKLIRRNKEFEHLPVIMFSTSSLEREKQSCSELGANYFFSKPNSFADYKNIVRALRTQWINPVIA